MRHWQPIGFGQALPVPSHFSMFARHVVLEINQLAPCPHVVQLVEALSHIVILVAGRILEPFVVSLCCVFLATNPVPR